MQPRPELLDRPGPSWLKRCWSAPSVRDEITKNFQEIKTKRLLNRGETGPVSRHFKLGTVSLVISGSLAQTLPLLQTRSVC